MGNIYIYIDNDVLENIDIDIDKGNIVSTSIWHIEHSYLSWSETVPHGRQFSGLGKIPHAFSPDWIEVSLHQEKGVKYAKITCARSIACGMISKSHTFCPNMQNVKE